MITVCYKIYKIIIIIKFYKVKELPDNILLLKKNNKFNNNNNNCNNSKYKKIIYLMGQILSKIKISKINYKQISYTKMIILVIVNLIFKKVR